MPTPGSAITLPDQFQFGSFVVGNGVNGTQCPRFRRKGGVRSYKEAVPGGGSYNPRNEATEMALFLEDLEVWGSSASDIETKWAALEAAFSAGPEQPFAWRLAYSTIWWATAHVETPPELLHDLASDVGFKRITSIGLVASDPTIHTI